MNRAWRSVVTLWACECWLLSIVIIMALGWAELSWAEPNPEQAHQLVVQRIDGLLADIQSSKRENTLTNEQKIALVDTHMGELVDFERIARRVMAKHYKRASEADKKQFLNVFKSSLLSTYANGLWEFDNYKVNVLPLPQSEQTLRNTQVSLEVITSSGQIFPVTQSLYYNHKINQWQVQNVIINGINMGLLFRDQFARLVAQHKDDIALAVDAWTSQVPSDD